MNVVDSSAWLSYFAGEPNAEQLAPAIEALDKLIVPSITLTEVFKHILRRRSEVEALQAVAQMSCGHVVDLDAGLAVDAAGFGVQLGLPLADSIIFATARRHKARLWTQDEDFRGLPDVEFFAAN